MLPKPNTVTDPSAKRRAVTLPARPRPGRRHLLRLVPDESASTAANPATRAVCSGGARPCPFVSCRHHLYLDVNPDTGSIKFNFPDLEVWELADTCALDVADRGGLTLDEVGEIMNLSRERIRQVEVHGLLHLKMACEPPDEASNA